MIKSTTRELCALLCLNPITALENKTFGSQSFLRNRKILVLIIASLLGVIVAVSQITPSLFLSGVDAAMNHYMITHRNITLIINATPENTEYHHPGVEVMHVPIPDQPHAALNSYFDSVSERIDCNRTGNTLVHCSAGRSRSPALILSYLMKYKGVTLRQAHEWVLEIRPHIRPNAGFWRQLMEYERTLFGGHNTVRMVATSCGVLPEAIDNKNGSAAYCVNV